MMMPGRPIAPSFPSGALALARKVLSHSLLGYQRINAQHRIPWCSSTQALFCHLDCREPLIPCLTESALYSNLGCHGTNASAWELAHAKFLIALFVSCLIKLLQRLCLASNNIWALSAARLRAQRALCFG